MDSMDSDLARKTVKNYACSNCWGDLEVTPDMRGNEMYFVICQKCKDETKGYVTKYFVNKQRVSSEFEKLDAVRLLQKVGVLPKPERKPLREGETNQDAIMRELGY